MKMKLGLRGLPHTKQITRIAGFVTGMTDNAHFPTPNPPLNTISLSIANAEAAVKASSEADQLAILRRTEKDDALRILLGHAICLGGHVQSASGGDAAIILSAGMSVVAPPAPIGELPKVQSFTAVFGGNEGELKLKWKGLHGALSYEIQMNPDLTNVTLWAHRATVTATKTLLTGLPVGVRLHFRVRGIGAAGPGSWSQSISRCLPQF